MIDKQYAGLVFGVFSLRDKTKCCNCETPLHSQNFKMLFYISTCTSKLYEYFLKELLPKAFEFLGCEKKILLQAITFQVIF